MGKYFDNARLAEVVRRTILTHDLPKHPRLVFSCGGTVTERLGDDEVSAEVASEASVRWERCPSHETLAALIAIGVVPSRGIHACDLEATPVAHRYAALTREDLAPSFGSPPRFYEVREEQELLWSAAARVFFRGELTGVLDSPHDHGRVRDVVVDIVSALPLPNFDHHNPHFMGQQLWLLRSGEHAVRKVIVEVARDGEEKKQALLRREHIMRLGYEYVAVDRAWAFHDPLRCVLAVNDLILGGDLCGSLIGPSTIPAMQCALCGEPMMRRDPTDIVTTRDVFDERSLAIEHFAHAECFFSRRDVA